MKDNSRSFSKGSFFLFVALSTILLSFVMAKEKCEENLQTQYEREVGECCKSNAQCYEGCCANDYWCVGLYECPASANQGQVRDPLAEQAQI